ncbi:MFS transporter [Flexivirga endophytica]|uniref:MFS transporter n=1 Tax=Flexivirga endophytica TaxID=1849103 RepID=A0A916TH20_9MICO|nr:MFS transporter [Flexivirga endophytica]GGB42809.1 MFS transporter [Flexivirga endophytica]GHB64316.1 MFS transporter [Flexivirga endophytica]
MKVLADITPLRTCPAFRNLWLGGAVSAVGGQFNSFAAMYAVWHLTGSSLMVGLLGLASGVPLVVIALVGSMFIDGVDRAALARRATVGQFVTSLLMAWAVLAEQVAILITLTAVAAALGALSGPARRALTPSVVGRSELAAAYALTSLAFQVSMLIGPGLAALVATWFSLPVCFLIDAATFLVALAGLRGLHRPPEDASADRGLRAAVAGFRFAAREPVVRGALLCDLGATFLAMPFALFPALNADNFDGTAQTLAWFTTAVAVGGVSASALSGVITHRPRPGLVMVTCSIVWGAALVIAGTSHLLPLTLGMLAVCGAADTWAVTSRTTLVQSATPDRFRGRLSALEQVVGTGGPNLGNFRAGAVGNVIGAGPAMALGGLTSILAVAGIVASGREMRDYTLPTAAPVETSAGATG